MILNKIMDKIKKSNSNPKKTKANHMTTYLIIILNDEKHLIKIKHISKIVKYKQIFPLPDSHKHLLGVSNISGEIIPVLNLKLILNISLKEITSNEKIIIVRHKGYIVGFLVNDVIDMIKLPDKQLKKDTTKSIGNEFIKGEFIIDKDVIDEIDVPKIIENYKNKK